MNKLNLEEIEARCKAATPEPWHIHESHNWHKDFPKEYFVIANQSREIIASWVETSAAKFIAHSRTVIPALITEVRRLRAELDRAMKDIPHSRRGYHRALPNITNIFKPVWNLSALCGF